MAINPGFILGPRFFQLSESVLQLADFVNRGPPFYFAACFPVGAAADGVVARVCLVRGRAAAAGVHVAPVAAGRVLEQRGALAPRPVGRSPSALPARCARPRARRARRFRLAEAGPLPGTTV